MVQYESGSAPNAEHLVAASPIYLLCFHVNPIYELIGNKRQIYELIGNKMIYVVNYLILIFHTMCTSQFQ